MITGELSPDEGLTVLSKGKVLGYLAQHQELDTDATIYEEVRKIRAYLLEWEQKNTGHGSGNEASLRPGSPGADGILHPAHTHL